MVNILINKITGAMAEIPSDGNLGNAGNDLLLSSDIITKVVSREFADHALSGHCDYIDGEMVLLPEDEWPENKDSK